MPLPRHEKRRAVSQNAKTTIPTANQSGNDKGPKLVDDSHEDEEEDQTKK